MCHRDTAARRARPARLEAPDGAYREVEADDPSSDLLRRRLQLSGRLQPIEARAGNRSQPCPIALAWAPEVITI